MPHGWQFVGHSNGVSYWSRPGKCDKGHSATTNWANYDLLHVFSSSAAPFEPEKSYSKFSAYALLYHNGDFGAAATALAQRGFGRQWSLRTDANNFRPRELGFVPRSIRNGT